MVAPLFALGAARAAKGLWDSAKHPRGPDGKFIQAGRLSFRVSPRSATVQYGYTAHIVPGKVNLYVGALARVERAGGHKTILERKIGEAGHRLVGKIPSGRARRLIEAGRIEGPHGTQVLFTKPKVRAPTVRVRSKPVRATRIHTRVGTTPTSVKGITQSAGVPHVRSPNRKPRTRSLPKSVAPAPKAVTTARKSRRVK